MISLKRVFGLQVFIIALICLMLIGLFHTSYIFIRLFYQGSVESIFYITYWAPIYVFQCLSFGASIMLLFSNLIKQRRSQTKSFNPNKFFFLAIILQTLSILLSGVWVFYLAYNNLKLIKLLLSYPGIINMIITFIVTSSLYFFSNFLVKES